MAGFRGAIEATFIGPEGTVLRALEGWPNEAITICLVAIALVVLIVALRPGRVIPKAILLAWLVLP